MSLVDRPQTSVLEIQDHIASLIPAAQKRLDKHGYGVAISPHEIFGILAEEMDELIDELRANNRVEFLNELVDIAIAAVFGMVSMGYVLDDEAQNGLEER